MPFCLVKWAVWVSLFLTVFLVVSSWTRQQEQCLRGEHQTNHVNKYDEFTETRVSPDTTSSLLPRQPVSTNLGRIPHVPPPHPHCLHPPEGTLRGRSNQHPWGCSRRRSQARPATPPEIFFVLFVPDLFPFSWPNIFPVLFLTNLKTIVPQVSVWLCLKRKDTGKDSGKKHQEGSRRWGVTQN